MAGDKGIKDLNEILRDNEYPGRGIVIGKSRDGTKAVFAYFIMGRSENSRNRVFLEKGGELLIQAFDPSKMKDPSLVIYSPVRVLPDKIIVTNGDHTDTVYDFLTRGSSFEAALETRSFEPDAPNYTPRISGLLDFAKGFSYKLSILKSADKSSSGCNRQTFSYHPLAGVGHFIHTYAGDGNPLPSFSGEPVQIAVGDDLDEFTQGLWEALDEDNKVSLHLRFIDIKSKESESKTFNKNT